jgi:hypothetical protein
MNSNQTKNDTYYIKSRTQFKIIEKTPSQEKILILASKVIELNELITSYVIVYMKVNSRYLPFKKAIMIIEKYKFCFSFGKIIKKVK